MPDQQVAEGGWTRVASADQVPPGGLMAVQTGRERVVLANVDGDLFALEDQCSHQEFPLSAGELDGDQVECSFHGARFDVRTGRATQLPAIRPVRRYDVEVRDGDVYVRLG